MRTKQVLLLACLMAVGVACTQKAADATKEKVGAALDATKAGADKAIDATKAAGDKAADAAQKSADKTADAAAKVADKTKDAVVTTGNAVTDTWLTGKLKAKFADDTALNGSDITIKTTAHVVRLTGTVGSADASLRARDIAAGTEGVIQVINQLVVK